MSDERQIESLYEGRFLRLVRRAGWEFAQRSEASGVVGIIAVTPERKLLLVEQYRIPVSAPVIEIPAGLAGDAKEFEGEALAAAATRELLEETGWQAERMIKVATGPSSAGLTDETLTLFRAEGMTRVGAGGGDAGERITVHEIPLDEAPAWIDKRQSEGALVDFKVWAALVLARHGRVD